MSEEQHKRISLIQSHLARQKLTEANKARKERILLLLIHLNEKFTFLLIFYRGILDKFNSFIKIFQKDSPMMHRVHSEKFLLCKEFISLFIKAEFIPEKSMTELLSTDFKKS